MENGPLILLGVFAFAAVAAGIVHFFAPLDPDPHRHTCPGCTVMYLCSCPSLKTEHRECPNCSGSRKYLVQWLT